MDHHLPALQRKYKYSSDTLMPYLYFFKYMARRPYDSEETADRRLRVWVCCIMRAYHQHLGSRHDRAE